MTNQPQKVSATQLLHLVQETNSKVDRLATLMKNPDSKDTKTISSEEKASTQQNGVKGSVWGGLVTLIVFVANVALVVLSYLPNYAAKLHLTNDHITVCVFGLACVLMFLVTGLKTSRWLKAFCSLGCMLPIALLVF